MKTLLGAVCVFPLLFPPPAFAQDNAGDAAAGKAFWQDRTTECRACHGDDGEGGFGPMLAGQGLTPARIELEVRRPAGIMPAFTEQQVGPGDIANLAAYFAGLPKRDVSGPWRYPVNAGMPKGQQTFHTVGCAQCHQSVFYRARANMGGMDADFDLFKRMVYAHTDTTPAVDAALYVDRSAAAPPNNGQPIPASGTRTARMRMGNYNPKSLPESRLKEIYDWARDVIGFRPLIEAHLSAPATTPDGATYTLTVANIGIKDKGWPAQGVVVDLAVPDGLAVMRATGEGYKGIHKAGQFHLVDVYGEMRATKTNIDVAEWLLPKMAAKDKTDLTITLSKAAPASDKLQGTIRWARPAPKEGDSSKEGLDIVLPRLAGAPAAAD